MANLDLINPFRYGRFAFQLAGHKLLRFCAPFLLLIGLTTSGLLDGDPVYALLFWLQAGFYLLGCVGGAGPLQQYRLVRVAHYFTMVQWAMLVAWGRYALGHQQVVWEPSKRQGIVADDQALVKNPGMTVLHIFSGDLWAGAEVVIFNLLSHLNAKPGLQVLALSLNEGVLAEKLRAAGITTYVIPEAYHSFA